MNILILGSGGREHALAWKLDQSKKVDHLFIAPGNAGTSLLGTNLPLDVEDFESIKTTIVEKDIEMVIVGPEIPLVKGIKDFFLEDKFLKNIPLIGPSKAAAQLEGSKDFAKMFMEKYQIPAAASRTFTKETITEAKAFLESLNAPYVLKADGLAGGKGVIILNDVNEAKAELNHMLVEEKFGNASSKVVIEEFLQGIEVSVFVLTDGIHYKLLPEAKDYKRIGEGDTGLNTGGMGSISPVPFVTGEFLEKVKSKIIEPTLLGIQKENLDYRGFIFFGLMNVNGEPYLIEYNCRMGDPETQSVIPRIKSDLFDLFEGVVHQDLDTRKLEIDERYATSVVMVSEGYPGKYEIGKPITGIGNLNNCILFYAGAGNDIENNVVKTSGGRVLSITSFGITIDEALKNAYTNIEHIQYEGRTFRKDLGFDLK
ncbi:MAG: phosphoribosylamine--glycine ligase [Bacteroidales bacterium]|nr:phosphoribosylamine--glycine ligase [Bacteroidales bacterium]